MRITIYIMTVVLLWSCNNLKGDQPRLTSRWLDIKDSFATKNVTEFKFDNNFRYENFHKISCKLLDSTMSDQWCKTYLYSWQERDSAFMEFTTVIEQEDRGVRIMYYVFNKKDSLISATPVAWVNVSDHEFSMWSKFKSKDTLISTHAITLYSKSGKTKGDTSVIEMAFNKNGKSSEKTIYEKKELKLGE